MTTLYKKVGRRYKPVAEHEEWDSYPEGAHLVVCSPGSTLRRFNVDPDRAGLLAAAEPLREQIRALVDAASQARDALLIVERIKYEQARAEAEANTGEIR